MDLGIPKVILLVNYIHGCSYLHSLHYEQLVMQTSE